MFKKTIYKYKDDEGSIIISPYNPNVEYEQLYRLIVSNDEYLLTKDYKDYFGVIDIKEKDLELWVEVHKDDLENPISTKAEINGVIDTTLETLALEDNAIDVIILLLEQLANHGGELDMVDFYVLMVKRGLKTIDQVPKRYKDEVIAILNSKR